jgi:hypothetical protein
MRLEMESLGWFVVIVVEEHKCLVLALIDLMLRMR